MMETDNIEPLDVAIRELGRRYNSCEISRQRRDARLCELSSKRVELRRHRSRSLCIHTPPPVTFLSIEEAAPALQHSHGGRA